MGSQNSTSSNSGGGGNSGGSGNRHNDRQNQINQKKAIKISKQVKKDIGLTAVGGLGGKNQGYIAANAANPLMYGGDASRWAKKRMQQEGLGTYNMERGSFQNVVGNKIISGTDKIMGGTMGDGSNSVMGQIPISKKMFESQKRMKTLAMLGMSAVMPGISGSLMRANALYEQSKRYNDYNTKFLNNQGQGASSFQSNETAQTQTANKGMGEVKTETEEKKSNKFSKFKSRTAMDTSGSIRKFWGMS